jgi:hypothetical protein
MGVDCHFETRMFNVKVGVDGSVTANPLEPVRRFDLAWLTIIKGFAHLLPTKRSWLAKTGHNSRARVAALRQSRVYCHSTSDVGQKIVAQNCH